MNDLNTKELTLIGAALYLCEGTKARKLKNGRTHMAIEFTNKDPRAIKMFIKFLTRVIKAERNRVKAELFIYPDLDERKLIKFWSKVSGIPKQRFNKTIVLKQKNEKYKPNLLGTLKIRYTHKEHFLKLQGIIDEVFGGVA